VCACTLARGRALSKRAVYIYIVLASLAIWCRMRRSTIRWSRILVIPRVLHEYSLWFSYVSLSRVRVLLYSLALLWLEWLIEVDCLSLTIRRNRRLSCRFNLSAKCYVVVGRDRPFMLVRHFKNSRSYSTCSFWLVSRVKSGKEPW